MEEDAKKIMDADGDGKVYYYNMNRLIKKILKDKLEEY